MADELVNESYESESRPCYGDVVAGIRRLGAPAVEQFLDDLGPVARALADGEVDAPQRIGRLLHDWGVTVAAIQSAGGLDRLAERAAAIEKTESVDAAIGVATFEARFK